MKVLPEPCGSGGTVLGMVGTGLSPPRAAELRWDGDEGCSVGYSQAK